MGAIIVVPRENARRGCGPEFQLTKDVFSPYFFYECRFLMPSAGFPTDGLAVLNR
jgi:hypothetical protein